MPAPRVTPRPGSAPPAAVPDAAAITPEALERHRFERDRAQTLAVVAAITIPIAAFGIIDAMLARSYVLLAAYWAVRGITLLCLAWLWYALKRAPTRARFERLVVNAQLLGVGLAVLSHLGRGRDTLIMTRFELLSVVIYYLMVPGRTRMQAVPAISLSAASLFMVLFWHTGVSGPELVSNVTCFALANVLGMLVAQHRQATAAEEETAWRALALAHERLQQTVAELRTLRGVVPICPHCHKVRGARNAWQQLEAYVSARGDVEFSPILCPSCLETEFGAVLGDQGEPG